MNAIGDSFTCASPAYTWNGPSGKAGMDQRSRICDYTGLTSLKSAGSYYDNFDKVGNDEASSVKCSCPENSFF